MPRELHILPDPRKAGFRRRLRQKRRTTPFRSAMSVLTFYINRAGPDLDAKQKKVLEAAKDELRKAFGKL